MKITVTPGRKIMGRLAKGDDLLGALSSCAREHGITLGEVQAIGAVTQARVGYYHQAERKYYFLELPRPLEIVSLIGNISLKDGEPSLSRSAGNPSQCTICIHDEAAPVFSRRSSLECPPRTCEEPANDGFRIGSRGRPGTLRGTAQPVPARVTIHRTIAVTLAAMPNDSSQSDLVGVDAALDYPLFNTLKPVVKGFAAGFSAKGSAWPRPGLRVTRRWPRP